MVQQAVRVQAADLAGMYKNLMHDNSSRMFFSKCVYGLNVFLSENQRSETHVLTSTPSEIKSGGLKLGLPL